MTWAFCSALLPQSVLAKPNGGYLLQRNLLPRERSSIHLRADPRFQPGNAAAADRNRVVICSDHLDHFAVAASPIADHALDIDDVAAVDANDVVGCDSIADSQRANSLVPLVI
jgi:hypothetical protein